MLINQLGQAARYMDDYGCMYGFLSTYEQTIFVRRTGPFTFKRSSVIHHTTSSSAQPRAVSVRECMFYLARLARRGRGRYHGQRIGDALVSNARFHCCILNIASRRTGIGGQHTIFELDSWVARAQGLSNFNGGRSGGRKRFRTSTIANRSGRSRLLFGKHDYPSNERSCLARKCKIQK